MLDNVVKYRSSIMGFAAIWVMLFHWSGLFPNVPPFEPLARCGYGGVDVFLLLSGLGLYLGYSKYSSVGPYYLKRFVRIFPTYLIVVFLAFFIKGDRDILHILIASTGVGYFLPFWNIPWHEWYVPTMVLLYLIFPFVYATIQKNIKFIYVYFVIAFILITSIILLQKGAFQILAISRFPVFLIGIFMGFLYKNKGSASKTENTTFIGKCGGGICLISIISYLVELDVVSFLDYSILWKKALFWLPFVVIAPGLCLLAGHVFCRLHRLSRFMSKIGQVSLEIYLLHMILLDLISNSISGILANSLFLNYLFFSILVVVSYYLSRILRLIVKPMCSLVNLSNS